MGPVFERGSSDSANAARCESESVGGRSSLSGFRFLLLFYCCVLLLFYCVVAVPAERRLSHADGRVSFASGVLHDFLLAYRGRRPSWPRKSIWSKNKCSDFSVSPSVT